jgi:adenine phosphoribosyltransferase
MAMDLKKYIKEVPDYPKPGISFKDLTPMLSSPEAYREATGRLADEFRGKGIAIVLAAEARGFLWGGPIARGIGAGLVPVRKPGKLPRETVKETYDLEYGKDELHMHKDAIKPGQVVLIVDDLLATGGTAAAMIRLVEKQGGKICALAFVVELSILKGRDKLHPHPVHSLVVY